MNPINVPLIATINIQSTFGNRRIRIYGGSVVENALYKQNINSAYIIPGWLNYDWGNTSIAKNIKNKCTGYYIKPSVNIIQKIEQIVLTSISRKYWNNCKPGFNQTIESI